MIPNVTYFTLSMVCTFAVFLSRDDIELFVRWAEKLKELMQTDATGRMKSQNASLSQQSGTSFFPQAGEHTLGNPVTTFNHGIVF